MLPLIVALATTPSPVVTPDESIVTPGPLGFAAIAFIAVAVFLLVFDMLRRIRRGRYREEVNAELDAEERAIAAQRAAEAAGRTDDEDNDPAAPRR
jgi:flagellar biosynthesis/type III secretory pathway M-ring protein FliF/YscJ